jgi:hypothetical protein
VESDLLAFWYCTHYSQSSLGLRRKYHHVAVKSSAYISKMVTALSAGTVEAFVKEFLIM